MLGGKTVIQPEVMIRGDLVRTAAPSSSSSSSGGAAPAAPATSTAVAIGRYCFLARGVLLRPLGNVLYAMPPACTTPDQARQIGRVMAELVTLP